MNSHRAHNIVVTAFTFASLSLAGSAFAQQPAAAAPGSAPPKAPAPAPGAEAAPAHAPGKKAPIYDEKADAKQQIAAAVAKANKENRRVLIQWGANWCGWCHLLHETCAKNADIKKELMYEYDVVLVDIGEGTTKLNQDIIAKYGAQVEKDGVPYLTILDGDGKVVVNHDTGSLEEGDHHDPAKVLAFLKANQAEYLTAESVLSEGMKQAKETNKVVFLHFGAPWCGWCHRLEDWMAQPEVNAVLSKDFVDVKIDEDRTIGGKELEAHYVGPKAQGIPWFAFVNPQNNEVLITSVDAAGQNTGFPAKDEEIAHFGAMLKKACKNATPAEIDALLASLKEANKKKS